MLTVILILLWLSFPVWVGGCQWIIVKSVEAILFKLGLLSKLVSFKESLNMSQKRRLGVLLASICCLSLGTEQAAVYFLIYGAYPWLVLLSFGIYLLLFLLPWSTLLLPFKKKPTLFWDMLFYLSTGLILCAFIALVRAKNVIYLTEAGTMPVPTNGMLKIFTLFVIGGYYLFCLALLLGTKREKRPKKLSRPSWKPAWHFKRPLVSSTSGLKRKLQKQNAPKLSLMVALLPLAFVSVVVSLNRLFWHAALYLVSVNFLGALWLLLNGLLSWLFLKEMPSWLKKLGLLSYTALMITGLLVYNLQWMIIRVAILATPDNVNKILNFILAFGLVILETVAWILPYLLFLSQKSNLKENGENSGN